MRDRIDDGTSGEAAAVRGALNARAVALAHAGRLAARREGGRCPLPPCGSWRGSSCGCWASAAGRWPRRRPWRSPSAARPSPRRRSFGAARVPGDRALARYIEEQCPALEDRLATAVARHRRYRGRHAGRAMPAFGVPCWPMRRGRSETCRSTASCPRERVRRAGVLAGLGVRRCSWQPRSGSSPGGRRCATAALYAIPGRLVLHVSPGDARVKRGARS